jgi:hypothetical protein
VLGIAVVAEGGAVVAPPLHSPIPDWLRRCATQAC